MPTKLVRVAAPGNKPVFKKVVVGSNQFQTDPSIPIVKQAAGNVNVNVNNPYGYVPPSNPAFPPPSYMPISGLPPVPAGSQFPGTMFGASWPEVQMLIQKQKKAQGFNFVVNAGIGVVTQQPINISGTASILLGMKIGNDMTATAVSRNTILSLMVNNDQIFENISAFFFAADAVNNPHDFDYISFPRPLSGSDRIILTATSGDAVNKAIDLIFYFL